MTVDSVEIAKPGCKTELQDWCDNHPSAIIKLVSFVGNFCYIFYE